MSGINDEVIAAVNAAAAKHQFRCVPVSWEDAQRGTVGGALSCWGGNISDVRLWEQTGRLMFTCRSENWNERLGYVSSKDVAVVVGNHVAGGSPPKPITLQNYLKNFAQHAGYAGATTDSLFAPGTDEICTIRFQTVFLPIEANGTTNFCTEVYNYNSRADDNPRNVLLLCSAQGTSVQHDGSGAKKLFHHEVDTTGKIHRYWLEAEKSEHKVGGSQVETEEEAKAAADRGKSTAIHIGTRAMGTRFNVQMLIQVPVKQKVRERKPSCSYSDDDSEDDDEVDDCVDSVVLYESCAKKCKSSSSKQTLCLKRRRECGESNAARVSRGKEEDVWGGVTKKDPERDPSMHPTITVTMYYTVVGGVPSAADVEAAVADLDALYKACPSDKRLVDCTEVTKELTVKEMQDSVSKVKTQPYQPPNFPPQANTTTFPE